MPSLASACEYCCCCWNLMLLRHSSAIPPITMDICCCLSKMKCVWRFNQFITLLFLSYYSSSQTLKKVTFSLFYEIDDDDDVVDETCLLVMISTRQIDMSLSLSKHSRISLKKNLNLILRGYKNWNRFFILLHKIGWYLNKHSSFNIFTAQVEKSEREREASWTFLSSLCCCFC